MSDARIGIQINDMFLDYYYYDFHRCKNVDKLIRIYRSENCKLFVAVDETILDNQPSDLAAIFDNIDPNILDSMLIYSLILNPALIHINHITSKPLDSQLTFLPLWGMIGSRNQIPIDRIRHNIYNIERTQPHLILCENNWIQ